MCYALRLHMSAAPPRVGLTQALGLMKRVIAICLFGFLLSAAGCSSLRQTNTSSAIPVEVIPLEQAKALIVSGQVKEIFQPHVGCVILTLNSGQYLSFDQPHLDWIIGFLQERGLDDEIALYME
jgi:hypothetical protein